jgi:steroid delta-isomerase-like uncharacterized protein
MSIEANKLLVRRLITEAQEGGNLAVVDELLADDFIDHSPLPGLPPTRDGVRTLFAGMRAAFPDLRVTIHEQIGDEEKVMTRKTFSGTHGGPFLGIPASGNPIAFEVIDILTIRGDKIREHRVILDQLGLMQQLGAIPATV